MVYFGSDDYFIYALNSQTGEIVWKFKTGFWVESSPVVAQGVVYIGSSDTDLYSLNLVTGTLRRIYDTTGNITSSPLGSNQTVYFGSYDTYCYALKSGRRKNRIYVWSRIWRNYPACTRCNT